MKNYISALLFLLVSQIALSQTPANIVKDGNYTIDSSSGTINLTATQSITLKPNSWIKSGSTFTAQIVENTTANDTYASFSFSNENYVFTRSFQEPMTSFNAATAKEGDVIEQITYFDGLGRAMQSIGIKAAPNDKKDIIAHIDYDDFGRQDKNWLPYHETTGVIGAYRGDRTTATKQYYQTNYGTDFTGVSLPDVNAYSEKGFEASPLNRVLQQGAPGKDWKLGGGNEIDFVYGSNIANEVRLYKVTFASNNPEAPQLSGGTTYYPVGELYKTITKDENHDGTTSKAHTTEEFKDKQGRVVLKRTYGTSVVNGTSQTNTAHDTYYVYDDFGNLSYVLPPKSEPNTALPDATELLELCYQYKYDNRNRLVEKKIPGKDWEYIVYNKLDQPVLTQDALQRPNKQWLFTKYDVFGRVVYTGIYTHGSVATRLQMVTAYNNYYTNNASEDLFEEKTTSEGSYHYYSNGTFPNTGLEVLAVNYYDDYNFNKDGLSLPSTADGQTVINHNDANKKLTKGLATGSKVKVLTTTNWITTLTGYDVKGRSVYIASKNNYLSTTDVVINKLDFAGKVDRSTTTHSKTGQTPITTQDVFVYDHEGRLLRQKQTINNLEQETIVDNSYDNLGQLESKGVGGKTSNANRLQNVDYSYNVRGWLKQINNPATLGSDLFGFKIGYNEGANALYNGNISSTQWKTANTDNSLKTYNYQYDALNRITSATDNINRYNLSGLGYDKNGNITGLTRGGHTNSGATTFGAMDNLIYTYQANSNKLIKVLDNSNSIYGFKDGINTGDDYTYDVNGNMLTDANKGISTNIAYNHLNLPTQVVLGGGNISYIYDATGVKLKKIVSTGATTEYAGNHVYENGSLKFFNHPEGYFDVTNPPTSGELEGDYVYQYKDHLGNIRLSYSDTDGNGSITAATEILEENNYYPFGLKHKGYNDGGTAFANIALKKTYNGKEFQDELGLDWHDYGARNYDASLGRWMNIDPLAEKYESQSPYTYAANNPAVFVDYDGRDFGIHIDFENGTITISQTLYTDGNEKTNKLAKETADALNSLSGAFGFKTKKNGTFAINFDVNVVQKDNEEDGREAAANDNEGNFFNIEEGSVGQALGIIGGTAYNARTDYGGDEVTFTNNDNVTAKVFKHENLHTLGARHQVIGLNGDEVNERVISAAFNVASNQIKNLQIKTTNFNKGDSFDKRNTKKMHIPKVNPSTDRNVSKRQKIKLRGTIIKIK